MADQPTLQEVEKTETVTGSTKFGFAQIGNPTPKWATWVFRIFFYITSTVSLFLSIATNLSPEVKLEIANYVVFANLAVHGLSKMLGVEAPTDFYKK